MSKRYGPYASSAGHLFWVELDEDGGRRSVWVHREVMERKLGRALLPTELVHHKDRNKTNNDPDNLELTTRSDHAREHAVAAEVLEVVCSWCRGKFLRRVSIERRRKVRETQGPFCTRRCAGAYTRARQLETGQVNLRATKQ